MMDKYLETAKKSSLLNVLVKKPFSEANLVLAVISLFPMLFVTKTVEAALVYGLVVLVLLLITTLLTSAFKKLISKEISVIFTMILLVGLATITKMLLDAFIPELTKDFGIYVYLLGVSPILYINVYYTANESVGKGLKEAFGVGLGLIIALIVTALFREVLATASLTLGRYLPISKTVIDLGFSKYAMVNLAQPYGVLIIFGIILACYVAIRNKKGADAKWCKF